MLDRVTPRTKMRDELITIIRMLLGEPPAVRGDLPAPEPATEDAPDAKQPETAEEQADKA